LQFLLREFQGPARPATLYGIARRRMLG
jgi:hypothetical protein